MAAIDYKILLTKNDCYKAGQKMTPKGIVVHSTGCNNPYLSRYVAPDNGVIGRNLYGNDWNRGGLDVCVHAFIGKDNNGGIKTVQTLPFNICCWGVGGGSKGSYNYNPAYIQFEMCEDGLSDKAYCLAVYNKAVEFCAYLCKTYGIQVMNIVSHYEAYQQGYGSGHVDPTNWWKHHGLTMDMFRAAVTKALGGAAPTPEKKVTRWVDLKMYTIGSDYAYSKGAVKTVQRILNDAGYKGKDGKALTVDGVYGTNTVYAVKAFQKKQGLTQDGIVGADTWKPLIGAKR